MIKLFRRFRDLGPVKQALFLWERADNHVDDLIAMGHELRGYGRDITPTERLDQIERITRINATLAGLGQAIAATLGEAQRAAQTVLLAGLFALGGMLLVAGIAISQRFVAQNDRLQEMLRESEAQLRYLIEVAPLPLLILRASDRRILYANERALQQFALDVDSIRGRALDRFRGVNDTPGHAAGDQLLRAVADRLKVAIRQSDMVARLAGDEFVVLIEDHRGPEEVMTVAQKVLAFIARPMLIDMREVPISASIGIASYPDDGDSVEALLRAADTAMYQAKEKGRNNFQFYSEDFNRVTTRRNELEKRVRDALTNGEFFLQYQPEIDLPTGNLR